MDYSGRAARRKGKAFDQEFRKFLIKCFTLTHSDQQALFVPVRGVRLSKELI